MGMGAVRVAVAWFLLLGVLAPQAVCEPGRRGGSKRLWIISVAALVAANLVDATSSMGQPELNPMLRNSRGQFSGGRALAFKSATSGGAVMVEALLMRRRRDVSLARACAIANFGSATALTAVGVRNTR
jgi:hypothetical protein